MADARGAGTEARPRPLVRLVSARHRGLGVLALGLVVTLVSGGPARGGAGAPDQGAAATAKPSAVGPKAGEAAKPPPPSAGAPVVATDAAKPEAKAKTKGKGRSPAELAKKLSVVRKAMDKSNAAVTAEGASSPPLDMAAMRAEVHRESRRSPELDATELPETKVEKMLAEVAKAREALHQDTLKLEALAAAAALKPAPPQVNPDDEGGESDGRPRTEGEAASGGAATSGGKPAKNPLDVLAKALRGIKPEQAAPIVTRLDPQLAASVLQRMPPADAGKILAAMKADNAAVLATLIAARKPRPEGHGDGRSSGVANPPSAPVARPEAPSPVETRAKHKTAALAAAADPAGNTGNTGLPEAVAGPHGGAEAAPAGAPGGAEAQK